MQIGDVSGNQTGSILNITSIQKTLDAEGTP